MEDNLQRISINFAEPKKNAAREALQDTVGLFWDTEAGIIFALKAPNIISIQLLVDDKRTLFVYGVTISATEAHNFESAFYSFVSSVKSRFSQRDLNISMIRGFACQLIQENLYRQDSEKPMPIELLLIQFDKETGLTYVAVDFLGNSKAEEGFCMIGCTDKSRQELFKGKIKAANLKSMEDVIKFIKEAVDDIKGSFEALTLSLPGKT